MGEGQEPERAGGDAHHGVVTKIMGNQWDNNSWEVAAQIAARARQNVAAFTTTATITTGTGAPGTDTTGWMGGTDRRDTPLPLRAAAATAQLLMQAVIVPGSRTSEGRLIEAVTTAWFDIVQALAKDPNVAFQIPPDKWEEMVAGQWERAGFKVTLTPRSGDLGRDVIGEGVKDMLGSIRLIDQVKAFTPPHLVTANDVRALMGVLQAEGASKGFLTTTSDFAPRIKEDRLIATFLPARLELINGTQLLARLKELAQKRPD